LCALRLRFPHNSWPGMTSTALATAAAREDQKKKAADDAGRPQVVW
jgi:hypothetical protein